MKTAPLEFEKPIADLESRIEELKQSSDAGAFDVGEEIRRLQTRVESIRRDIYSRLTAWQRVQIARHPSRPYFLDFLGLIATDFVEFHGDRLFGDDHAMPAGLATIGGLRCAVIGHQKGRDLKENIKRNFGCGHPEGYRKALRVMRLAEKFRLPVLSMIDTPGAFPGIGAEERHISEAISVNLREMMLLETPILSVVIGEGGSGGALGIGVGDRILMMANAYYSVISPEGCAAILWKHRSHAPEAAEALKLTARDLEQAGVVDEVIPEPETGAHRDHRATADILKAAILKHFGELMALPADELLERRYQKYRRIGPFFEPGAAAKTPSV
jgi:acetyl-CoA carboxylase carboxyl transferase subunit alpha